MLKYIIEYAPMFVALFWAFILLIMKTNRNKAKITLGILMCITAFTSFLRILSFEQQYTLYQSLESVYTLGVLITYPLFFLYIYLLTNPRSLSWRAVFIFLPAIIYVIINWVLSGLMSDEENFSYVHQIIFQEGGKFAFSASGELRILLRRLYIPFLIVEGIVVCVMGTRSLISFNKQVRNFYSDASGRDLNVILNLFLIFVFVSIANLSLWVIARQFMSNHLILLIVTQLLYSVILYVLGYYGFMQNFTAADFYQNIVLSTKDEQTETSSVTDEPRLSPSRTSAAGVSSAPVARSGISPASSSATLFTKPEDMASDSSSDSEMLLVLEKRMTNLMEIEELYKHKDLRVSDITTRLKSNRTYVSKVLNQNMNLSFSDWVNQYRVEHAKQMLRSKDNNYSMTYIAKMSGFSSESSFFRIFKDSVGSSPAKWRSQEQLLYYTKQS